MPPDEGLRIAVDIGGTFTDCVVLGEDGTRVNTKALTTRDDPVRGVFDCLNLVTERLDSSLYDVLASTTSFVHGTTVGTNALVERRGARTALLMTHGHEETFTIGRVRQKVAGLSEREKTHITHLSKADPPIVVPSDVRPVRERIDVNGRVIMPLDLVHAGRMLDELVAQGIESVAICLLWSFVNRQHEAALRQLVVDRHPSLYVAASSDVAPILGEYERAVSTVLNAYLGPLVGGYLDRLEQRLKETGLKSALLVMQANGGVTSVEGVRHQPLLTVDSGPAGGVLGSKYHSDVIAESNAICADVGGTTFDVGLVFNGRVQMDRIPVIDKYEYAMPKVSVKSIGAGGGSIAWLDPAGSLRVGPQSAGADPGPACYGRGGERPTVTDAHLVLGYLDAEYPLGGHVQLDVKAAEAAIETLAKRLGMSMHEVAAAMAAISNAQMADLVRRVTVERGLDPREFVIFAYGGAGPVFAAFLAQQIGSRLAYVPSDSGVFSAFGMLTTDLLVEEQRSSLLRTPLASDDVLAIRKSYEHLESRVLDRFVEAGFDREAVGLRRAADMRMAMQVHELEVDVESDSPLTETSFHKAQDDFVEIYERTYGAGSAYTEAGIEIAKLRAAGTISLGKPALKQSLSDASSQAATGKRPALFHVESGFEETAVFQEQALRPGFSLLGPAVVQRLADTIVIPPKAKATVDEQGGVLITWEEPA